MRKQGLNAPAKLAISKLIFDLKKYHGLHQDEYLAGANAIRGLISIAEKKFHLASQILSNADSWFKTRPISRVIYDDKYLSRILPDELDVLTNLSASQIATGDKPKAAATKESIAKVEKEREELSSQIESTDLAYTLERGQPLDAQESEMTIKRFIDFYCQRKTPVEQSIEKMLGEAEALTFLGEYASATTILDACQARLLPQLSDSVEGSFRVHVDRIELAEARCDLEQAASELKKLESPSTKVSSDNEFSTIELRAHLALLNNDSAQTIILLEKALASADRSFNQKHQSSLLDLSHALVDEKRFVEAEHTLVKLLQTDDSDRFRECNRVEAGALLAYCYFNSGHQKLAQSTIEAVQGQKDLVLNSQTRRGSTFCKSMFFLDCQL